MMTTNIFSKITKQLLNICFHNNNNSINILKNKHFFAVSEKAVKIETS